VPLALDPAGVGANPGLHPLAHRPGSVSPESRPDAHAGLLQPPAASCSLLQPAAAPAQELRGEGAERAASDDAPPDALGRARPAQQHPRTGQCLRVGIALGGLLLAPAQRARGPAGSSPQRCACGWAHRLHPVSAAKPSAPSGCCRARAIRRSRRLVCGRIPGRGG
jgi:hypothetical protein